MSMTAFKYSIQETINGVTLTYAGPEQDPQAAPGDPTIKEGDLEDYFLWMDGDPSAKHVVIDVDTNNGKVKVLARQSKTDWWKYRIFTTVNPQTFQRRKKGDLQWGEETLLSTLWIKLDGEATARRLDSIIISNDNARIEHQGSNCSLVWNPATRRYVRKCV